jgi:hypothetical protein
MRVEPGMIVRDDHDRLGIVAERANRPSPRWLREQLHPISEADAAAQWWTVHPLDGGLILSPETLLSPIRRTTYDDFLVAVEGANVAGRKSLAAQFPEYVERARSARAGRE